MDYSFLMDQMVWSHSRIKVFKTCPYKFFLTYILGLEEKNLFFSDFGSFMHSIIELIIKREVPIDEAPLYYLSHFQENVKGIPMSRKVFQNYFEQGLNYLKNFSFPYDKILAVEQELRFSIGNKNFVAIVDAIAEDDDGVIIIDNKSRNLRQRSKRKKPTKQDAELDKYFRQLYIYSQAIHQKYGDFPHTLCFNCFRNGEVIKETFDKQVFDKIMAETLQTIEVIRNTTDWTPHINQFFCNNLCGVCDHCEYKELASKEVKGKYEHRKY